MSALIIGKENLEIFANILFENGFTKVNTWNPLGFKRDIKDKIPENTNLIVVTENVDITLAYKINKRARELMIPVFHI